jgi:ATP-dependent Clp protease ATP-binding subunit ClpA
MFERFTEQARESVVLAQEESRRLRHGYIGTEHLLLGLLGIQDGAAARALERFGVDLEAARADVARVIGIGSERLGEDDAEALRALGIDLDEVRRRVEAEFGPGALDWPAMTCRGGPRVPAGRIPFTCRAKKVLELAVREAVRMRNRFIGTEHILLGIVREREGLAAQILDRRGAAPEAVRSAVARELAGPEGLDGTPA